MDYDKLIEELNNWNEYTIVELCGMGKMPCQTYCDGERCIVSRTATAIETFLAENEKLREEVEHWKNAHHQATLNFQQENRECNRALADLARVTEERDAIEQHFRAFTKQWWEEANGFPCQFCKFENSGGCEQKAKHPDDEKPCAGRWFEWRGIKKED